MPDLSFSVNSAHAVTFAAAPTIAFGLRVMNAASSSPIHSVALHCQIKIETQRRQYSTEERRGLRDLFGEPERWSQTLKPLLWTHVGITVPEFEGSLDVELPVACTFDFNVAAAKYFHALRADDAPLVFQFSGTVFFTAPDGSMQIAQIGWNQEARFRLPSRVWSGMMDLYYPNSAWLRLRRDVFDRLHDYKQENGLATWEQTIELLLPAAPLARKEAAL